MEVPRWVKERLLRSTTKTSLQESSPTVPHHVVDGFMTSPSSTSPSPTSSTRFSSHSTSTHLSPTVESQNTQSNQFQNTVLHSQFPGKAFDSVDQPKLEPLTSRSPWSQPGFKSMDTVKSNHPPILERSVDRCYYGTLQLSSDELLDYMVSLTPARKFDAKQTSPYFRVPAKIKFQILEQVFPYSDTDIPITLSPIFGTAGIYPESHFLKPWEVLWAVEGAGYACKQMRDEMMSFFWSKYKFHVVISKYTSPNLSALTMKLLPNYLDRIQHLVIEADFTKLAFSDRIDAHLLESGGITHVRDIIWKIVEGIASRKVKHGRLATITDLHLMIRRIEGDRPINSQPYCPEIAMTAFFPVGTVLAHSVIRCRLSGFTLKMTRHLLMNLHGANMLEPKSKVKDSKSKSNSKESQVKEREQNMKSMTEDMILEAEKITLKASIWPPNIKHPDTVPRSGPPNPTPGAVNYEGENLYMAFAPLTVTVPGELSFKKYEYFIVTHRGGDLGNAWLLTTNESGVRGWVPENHMQQVIVLDYNFFPYQVLDRKAREVPQGLQFAPPYHELAPRPPVIVWPTLPKGYQFLAQTRPIYAYDEKLEYWPGGLVEDPYPSRFSAFTGQASGLVGRDGPPSPNAVNRRNEMDPAFRVAFEAFSRKNDDEKKNSDKKEGSSKKNKKRKKKKGGKK